MKIKTEIVQNFFVVTCEGRRLDAPFAQNLFNSMQSIIQKGHMDIVIDLSSVEFVDSTGLGAIVRCLKEINGRGRLVLCGVNEMVLSLLKMTRLDDVFLQAATPEEAFKRLAGAQKKKKAVQSSVPLVESASTSPKVIAFDDDLLSSLKMEDSETVHEVDSAERRKYLRINKKQIVNEDIIVHCTNIGTGKRLIAVVLNISPGGLLLVSPSRLTVGHEFILEGRIGRSFRFKEHAVIRNCRDGEYGLEFIKPSKKTTGFLHQLTGSAVLSKGQLNQQ